MNMLAYSTDNDLKNWTKLHDKRALRPRDGVGPFDASSTYTVFDPDTWYDEANDAYYQITGGMRPGIFKSKSLSDWQYVCPLIADSERQNCTFEDLSCPEFFNLGGGKSMILFISHTMGAQYYLGTFVRDRFVPESYGRMNWPGGTLFASEQLQDASGRNIMWGWVIQPHDTPLLAKFEDETLLRNLGWSGIMSLPRVLSLGADGALQIEPAEELHRLRRAEISGKGGMLPANEELTLEGRGTSVELEVELKGGAHSPYGVKVLSLLDGREETIVRYEPGPQELVIDFSKSRLGADTAYLTFDPASYDGSPIADASFAERLTKVVKEQRAPLKLKPGESLRLNIYIDRSVIEVFANGRQAMIQVIYPSSPKSCHLKVFSGDEPLIVARARCWQMAASS